MSNLLISLRLIVLVSLFCCVFYTGAIFALARGAFTESATAGGISVDGQLVGSKHVGQSHTGLSYFWSRPSTSAAAYDPAMSRASHLPYASDEYMASIKERAKQLQVVHPNGRAKLPIDLLTSSASGLDPHISMQAAKLQISRVAKARKIEEVALNALVEKHTESEQWGIFGQPRVNVLMLNLALESMVSQDGEGADGR